MMKLLRFSFIILALVLCCPVLASRLENSSTSHEGSGWQFAKVMPAEGTVSELSKVTFSYPDGVQWVIGTASLDIACPGGKVAKMFLMDNFKGGCDGTVLDEVLTTPGSYTLVIPEGTFSSDTNIACAGMTYNWTIAGDDGNENAGGEDNKEEGDDNGDDPQLVPCIELNITKTYWATIGSQSGETIGTATLLNANAFDHIEAEIRCEEDPDQYITFSNIMTNGGSLKCYAWEHGSYQLNKGYHYTITVKAFDVPYYGVAPIATTTYSFVGQGVEAVTYNENMCLVDVALKRETEDQLINGYVVSRTDFDVTFSEPVSKVNCWAAMGFEGSVKFSAEQKSTDGTVWTILVPESILNEEGAVNVLIQAWDAQNVMAKGENGDHAFSINLKVNRDDTDGIRSVGLTDVETVIYTLWGVPVASAKMQKGQVCIIKGRKQIFK